MKAFPDTRPRPRDSLPLRLLKQGWKQALGWILPSVCLDCGRHLSSGPKSGNGKTAAPLSAVLCRRCLESLRPIGSPLCTLCGLPFATGAGPDHLCAACTRQKRPYGRLRAVFAYGGPARGLIQAFKYQRMTGLASPLGKLLFQTLARWWDPAGLDLAVPVALHPRKERKRTFNQAWLLLKACQQQAAANGIELAITNRALCRQRYTRSQAGLDRQQRRRNVKGAFGVIRPDLVKGQKILLIDDVFTTGSTLEACCRSLLQAGAAGVDALVLARVV